MFRLVQKFNRQIIAGMLIFSLIVPNVASAQLAVTAPVLEGQTILDYIQKLLKVVFRNVVVVGAVQVSQKIAKDAAESMANWVWNGAPGANPLTYMKNPGDYIKDQTSKALGDVLDQMSSDIQNADLLCISDPSAPLGVLGGLYNTLNKTANTPPFSNGSPAYANGKSGEFLASGSLGKCDAGSIMVSYKSLTNELSSDELLKRFSNAATNGGSEVDQVVASQIQAMSSLVREQKSAELERTAAKSYKDQTAPISGSVTQPAAAVAEDSKLNTAKFQAEQEGRQLSGILASGAEAIPAIFATTFANALSKKIIEKLKRGKGTNPTPAPGSINLANVYGAGKTSSNATAGALYSDVKTTVISEGGLDLLTSFVACLDKYNGPDNCVMDESFASAIRAADSGKALTVQEAIDQDKLHANWELVPPSQTARNEDILCAKSAYCFSNLTKMRKARIIPIGWEIAAATANGTGKTTLGDVVKGFNTCAYNTCTESGVSCTKKSDCKGGDSDVCAVGPTRDKSHPYCHLIDPNWVLKIPEQICRAKVYGPQPQSELGSDRQEVCSDQASCLQEDATGRCTGAYGYCLREKNTFRFEADECPAQFAGCRTYQNTAFGNISLIDATIEAGTCNDKNTGCMGYIADYDATGALDAKSPKVYLNAKAQSCSAANIGCTEVQDSTGKQKFLRLPPAGMGCKGLSSDPTACSQYAKACSVDEVGCEIYQPIGSTDEPIPGVATFATRDVNDNVVDWNDECSQECVGYASYYQMPTQIEPVTASSTAFIPKSATQCTQEVAGCDAYQNIDVAAKGGGTIGYFANVQKCSDPEVEKNHAVFYSWEGSDQAGYQLHQHDLVTLGDGSPKYDIVDAKLLAIATAECTADKYKARIVNGKPDPFFNTDCRELFDQKGAPFYRLLSKTIVSTPECVAFRKDKADKANCDASNGKYDSATNSCQYGFLPSGSTQCKKEEVGCRGYNGAAALSPKVVLNESFASADGWSGGTLSNEGITVGDTVLKLTGGAADHAMAVTQNKTYSIVFWAKGQGTFSVKFKSATYTPAEVTLNATPLTAGPEWRRYEVSSPPAPWADDAAKLVFEKVAGSGLYIENLIVKEQVDVQYVIRDSWVTPQTCDPIPGDNIPGPALNCQAYKPKTNTTKPAVYLTGFTSLCRAPAAGCQKFVNTQNTAEITEHTYSFGTAERKVPADEFAYIIADSKASCPADKKGCSALGVYVDGKLETVTKINNPTEYEATSCAVADEWCQTFTTSGGTQRYFKYPEVSKQCEYREGVEKNGSKYTGWFKKNPPPGTADLPCYENFVSGGSFYGIYKNEDKNFTGMAGLCSEEFNQCTEFVDHADVSKDAAAGKSYFFMKNTKLDTSSCNGKVSLKDGCVALDETTDANKTISTYCKSDPQIDPLCAAILQAGAVSADDQKKDGVPVAPSAFSGNSADVVQQCKKANENGLLTATDCDAKLTKLNEIYGAANVSALKINCSNTQNLDYFMSVLHATCATVPNANLIVKVRRDRTCAEWLACQSSISVYDKNTQKFKDVCTGLGVCNKLSTDTGAVGQCANWVTPQQLSADENLQRSLPLTTARYVSRNVGWYGHEFSGYSLWHKFQPDTVGRFSESKSNAGDLEVGVGFVSTASAGGNTVACEINSDDNIGKSCVADVFAPQSVKDSIVAEFGNVDFNGKCFEQKCWYPIDGFKPAANPDSVDYTQSSCRGYPEKDSPFPQSVVTGTNIFGVVEEKDQGYEQVNVCEQYRLEKPARTLQTWSGFDQYKAIQGLATPSLVILNGSCDCSYKKVEYGATNEKHYYSIADTAAASSQGKPVLALWKADEGKVRWYQGKVAASHDSVYDIQYDDGDFEANVDPSHVVFLDDKTPVAVGKLALANFQVYGDNGYVEWYEGTVTGMGTNIVIKFNDPNVPIPSNWSASQKSQRSFGFAPEFVVAKDAISDTIKSGTPSGICNGGWFVVGSKLADNPEVVSKKGLTCSTDFDCIDERVAKIKMPASVDGNNVQTTNANGTFNYQYSSDDGKCDFKKKETTVYGWKGYCLEKDLSAHLNNTLDDHPCLTWLPIDVAGLDIYNQYASAGYSADPNGAGQFYCVQGQGRAHAAGSKTSYAYQTADINFSASGFGSSVDFSGSDIDKGVVAAGWGTTPHKLAGANCGTDCSNDNIENRWIESANYIDNPVGAFHAEEVDYIELSATGSNTFFPVGYTMKIVNDGKVRVYYNAGMTTNNQKCPAFAPSSSNDGNNNSEIYYDFLDPQAQTHDTNIGTKHQSDILSALSQQVRCGANSGGLGANGCNYYQGGDTGPYFSCSTSEKKLDDKTATSYKYPLAVTGVARTGTSANYVPQITSGELSQSWFVRIDNQSNVSYPIHADNFLIYDMIHGKNNVMVGPNICTILDQNGNNDDAKIQGTAWKYGHHQGYELRFKFNKDGLFDGIDAASCAGEGHYSLSAGWKVTFHMRNACLKVAQTVGSNNANAAFTHRLWDGFPAGFGKAFESSDFSEKGIKVGASGIISPLQRFGALVLGDPTPTGLAFSYLEMTDSTADGFKNAFSTGAAAYSCIAGKCLVGANNTTTSATLAEGVDALHELYGKFYALYSTDVGYNKTYTSSTGASAESLLGGKKMDITADGADHAPVIFAFDPTNCSGPRGGTCRLTRKYGVTVNGEYDDGAVVFGQGSVAATMQFYGYADQNQMPLKQVSIDWKDGTAVLQKKGTYRNHKPVCSTQKEPVAVCTFGGTPDYNHVCMSDKDCVDASGKVPSGASCDLSKDHLKWSFGSWGGNGGSDDGACEPDFFQFTHAYTFAPDCGVQGGKAQVATADLINQYKLQGKIGLGERFCVFKPRVQLLDNWGACNGIADIKTNNNTPQGYTGGLVPDGDCITEKSAFTPFQGNIVVKE